MDATEALAAGLLEARQTRRHMPAAAAERLAGALDVAGRLAVQARTVAALGPVGAWKASPSGADGPGPFAPILARDVRSSGATFTTDELSSCGVELEIAFRIDRPLPAPDAADFDAALRAAVTPVAVIEVIDSRMEAFAERSPAAKHADLLVNGGLVVGDAAVAGWPDMARPEVALALAGASVLDGPQEVPGGDAFATLVDFARSVGGHCGGLRVGHVVTTGALGGMRLVPPGTDAEGRIAGLGGVAMRFG